MQSPAGRPLARRPVRFNALSRHFSLFHSPRATSSHVFSFIFLYYTVAFPTPTLHHRDMSLVLNNIINNAITIDESFARPALDILNNYVRNRHDPKGGFSDERFLRTGLCRVLDGDDSGRAFLQALADAPGTEPVARATWFDALHSPRRLRVLDDVTAQSYRRFEKLLGKRDWLENFPELKDHPVWAVDGHQIEHASHAQPDEKGRQVSSGSIYMLCLHTGLLRSLAPYQGDGQRRAELPVFKENWRECLTGEPRKGMPIVVGDPAYVDGLYWVIEKIKKQVMIITREKENMKPTVYGANEFDASDPVNKGVEADEDVYYSNAALRRIRYRDPASGELFVFITTCRHLRPGVIALLYLLRWKIEKVYDVLKNKLKEQKAWACGQCAREMQSHFMALLHNLLAVLLAQLEERGIRERKVEERSIKRRQAVPEGKRVPAQEMVRHAYTMTCQFIRLLRHAVRYKYAWDVALPLFRLRLEAYI